MKIKDIRGFRTYYKEQVNDLRDDNRNEHFLGQKKVLPDGGNVYGFFHIYHGDKADIRQGSFLTSFLDMARDSQVVYEFLQNAVDANSTEFALVYDDEYCLVINNGEQFSFEGIRAILNVGSSSKEESSDIGKFGIGFKLVHRLIGENSAIEELTEQHLGPILFSWSKKKHLEKLRALRSLSEIEPVPQSYHAIARVDQERDSHQCGDPEPWLFKILVTNFPCQPGEEVHDINYQLTNSLFAEAELLTLVDWVNRKLPVNLDNFEQGSLFFLKLGPGKKRYLEGEYLEHGVKSSLSLLNKISEASHKKGLERVYLNAAEITHPSDLAYEKFVLPGGSRAHNYVRPRKGHFAEENAVEFLLGYCRDFHQSQSLIHGYPNFYLFFPILEEVHNLHFILHSNAFYNGSHRTSLHLGGESGEKDDYGINERLLEVFADQLIERLEQYRVGDRERFAAIYAALLLSGPANERHKKWVDKPLYQPLLAYLREHIPTQSQGENWCVRKESVRIKKTALKICLEDFGIHHVRWFYWDDPLLNREASLTNETGSEMSNSKLGLTAWNVVDVIEALPGDAEILAFGKWIASLERDDPATYQAFFAEINDGIGYNPSPGFIKTFFALPVFRFGDTFCSINDLAGPAAGDKLFCMEQTAGLRDILGILNIEMSSLNISDVRWRRVKFNIENRLPQLADGHPLLCLDDDARLLNYIQEAILKDPNGLSTEQKIRLFKTVLEGFDNALRDSIGNLRLFVNTLGELQPLHQMLPFQPENYPAWLTPFMIAASDYLPDEQRDHLVAPERIFGDVVVPNWERIIAGPNLPEQIADFYDEVGSLFRKSTGDVPTWDKRPFVYVDRERGFLTPDAVLFHPGLANLGEPEYQVVEKALRSLIGKPLPNFAIVSALRKAPFAGNFAAVDFGAEVGGSVDLTHRETVLLRDAVDGTGADFFEWFVVRATQVSDQYRVEPRGDKMQCFCSFKHPQLSRFIESDARLQDTLLFLPANLYEPRMDKTALLTGKALYQKALGAGFQETQIEVARESDDPVLQKAFLESIPEIALSPQERYDATTFPFRVFEMALNCCRGGEKGRLLEMLARKILIVDRTGQRQLLEDVADNNQVSFTGKDGISGEPLNLSKILPRFSATGGLIEEVLSSFVDFPDPKALRKSIFQIGNARRKSFVYKELKEEFPLLENAEQLAFVVLYAANQNMTDHPADPLIGFNVRTHSGIFPLRSGFLLSREVAFLSRERLLDGYDGIERLLGLDNENPAAFVGEIPVVFCTPVLREGIFYAGPAAENLLESADHQKQAFLSLFTQWQESRPERIELALPADGELSAEAGMRLLGSLQPLLSFSPTGKVYPGKFALDSLLEAEAECFPAWLELWLDQNGDSDKTAFLKMLGVFLEDSPLVRLRGFLFGEGEFPQNELIPAFAGKGDLLVRSLRWLSRRESFHMCEGDPRLGTMREIYRLIDLESRERLPLLVLDRIVEKEACFVLESDPSLLRGYFKEEVAELPEGRGLSQILEKSRQQGERLLCLDLYPENWQEALPMERLSLAPEILEQFDQINSPAESLLLAATATQNQSLFEAGMSGEFAEVLLKKLSQISSPWSRGFYHYTSLENAVSILREGHLLSRNALYRRGKGQFVDLAGPGLLHQTPEAVRETIRFYFRPLVPFQWHVEGFGRGRIQGDPKCPVPVYFKFDAGKLLRKYGHFSQISDQNLATGKAVYGNGTDNITRFDFVNLYQKYDQGDFATYLRASQQELIISGVVDLNDVGLEIICRNEQEKSVLENLLGGDHPMANRIRIDGGCFFDPHPAISVSIEDKTIKAHATVPGRMTGKIRYKPEQIYALNANNNYYEKQAFYMETDGALSVTIPRGTPFSVYYREGERSWLIYRNAQGSQGEYLSDRTHLKILFAAKELDINSFINLLKRWPECKGAFGADGRGFRLESSLWLVVRDFETHFAQVFKNYPQTLNLLRIALAFKEIERALQLIKGYSESSQQVNKQVVERLYQYLPFGKSQIMLLAALLAESPLDPFLEGRISNNEVARRVLALASKHHIKRHPAFFSLVTIFYQASAASPLGEKLKSRTEYFMYGSEDKRVFDPQRKRFRFASLLEEKYELLEEAIIHTTGNTISRESRSE